MDRILISACLLGHPVRYDGGNKYGAHPLIERWRVEGRFVVVCPEVIAGLAVPRPATEISDGLSGDDVLVGQGKVIDASKTDYTATFIRGANAALEIATKERVRFALLVDGSPSCGSTFIYDGSFTGRRKHGQGVVAALLRQHGIAVYPVAQIEMLAQCLDRG